MSSLRTDAHKAESHERDRNRFIVERLPAHLQTSFTDEQLSAIRHAFTLIGRTPHRIDYRLSIPLPWRPFYFVLLAGPERRSKSRVAAAQRAFVVRAIVLSSIVLGSGLVFALTGLNGPTSGKLRRAWQVGRRSHPTVVPFKHNKTECEASGREWKDEQCVDHDHDHTF